MTKKILAAIFGALLFGIAVPIAYWFAFNSVPFHGLNGILLLVAVGIVIGATLGALFPRVFGFIFGMFMDI